MIDLMLIAGSALCVLSIIMAIISVAQTRAPRGAAIALMLGIIVLLIGAKMEPASINAQNMVGAWKRLFAGEVSLSREVAAPVADAPVADAPAADAPAAEAPASGEAAPASTTSEPAASQPATTQ